MTDPASVKEARTTMRRVHEHVLHVHENLGIEMATEGFVDVTVHPQSSYAALNYITPRRNTAWVSAQYIEAGLQALRSRNRVPRLRLAEGLFPPLFTRSLRDLGLVAEQETPIMVLRAEHGFTMPDLPAAVQVSQANDATSVGAWLYTWRSVWQDGPSSEIMPLLLQTDLRNTHLGEQINLIIYRYGSPVAAMRVTLHERSALLSVPAMLPHHSDPSLKQLLQQASIRTALDAGCDLIFSAGQTPDEREQARSLGFQDAGSLLSYVQSDLSEDIQDHEPLAQPVLIL